MHYETHLSHSAVLTVPSAEKFDCDFAQDDCNYSPEAESSLIIWRRLPINIRDLDNYMKFVDQADNVFGKKLHIQLQYSIYKVMNIFSLYFHCFARGNDCVHK